MKRDILKAIASAFFLIMTLATAQASNLTFPYNDDIDACKMTERKIRGDVSGDGERTVVDVTMIVNYILTQQADFELWLGDLDCDSNITIIDITILVNIILGAEYNDPDNPNLPLDDPEGGDPGTGL